MPFDPNSAAGEDSGIFGLPYDERQSSLVLIPVPWEATTSYGGGTSRGPDAILRASRQVDLFDYDILKPYEAGIFLRPEDANVRTWNEQACSAGQERVNELGAMVNASVRASTESVLAAGKIAGIVGGDHSVPFGAMQAMADRMKYGILHFDAHSDTRDAFEGYTWSHASIFHNVLERIPGVTKLVQVGIRDFCEEEFDYCRRQGDRVKIYFDAELARKKFEAVPWAQTVTEIVAELPKDVWVSFDVDGLDPNFCPHTGTPVPGGLDFREANYLIGEVVRSGRRIIGFDLDEVAPGPDGDEWDANVGARLLYKLCAWTLASHGKARRR